MNANEQNLIQYVIDGDCIYRCSSDACTEF